MAVPLVVVVALLLFRWGGAGQAAAVPVNFTALTLPNDFLFSKSDFITSDLNQFYFPLTKSSQMNEKISRVNYPQIQQADYLDFTDGFATTLRGFVTIDELSKQQYLNSMGESLATKSDELLKNMTSWPELFTGSFTKSQIESLPAGWQYLVTEQIFRNLGGGECAGVANRRPTSLGLLLKLVAVMRDQPEQARADFISSLASRDQLASQQLHYMLAYRWLPGFSGLSLSNLLSLPPDTVLAINGSQFDLWNLMDRLKNVKAWSQTEAWSMAAWFQLVNSTKGFESMTGANNVSNYGHLLTGAPPAKIKSLVSSRKLGSFSLASLIQNPAMDNLKVQELWSGLSEGDQVRVFPSVGHKLAPHQLRTYLQRTKTDVSALSWLDENSNASWSAIKVAGGSRLSLLPGNISTWASDDLTRLANWSIVLSPLRISALDPRLMTRPVVDSMLSSRMTTGQLRAIYDQYKKVDRGPGSSLPPQLLTFLPPEVIAGAGGAKMVASDRGLQSLLAAAKGFVGSQRRALYELLEPQLWAPSVLRSVLLLYPDLLSFTPVREFKTRINNVRSAVSVAGEDNFGQLSSNIKKLPRRLLTAWLEQVFSLTNKSGMWVTSVLLDLPPGGGRPTYSSLFGQGDPSSLLPSLALTGLSCDLINRISVEDSLEVLAVYRSHLLDGGMDMPSSNRKCWARQVRKFLYLKSTLFNVTVKHEVELLSLMSTADIRTIGGDVLLTWGGRILTGITHPQVMVESLVAVSQESPSLYLNNGVWLSDMAAMAETLYLTLNSTGVANLGILTRMRDLIPYLASKYLTTFTSEDIQIFVRSVLRSSRGARTICTTAEGRRNVRDLILKGYSSPATWSSGDLVDLGDLLIVLTPEDFRMINSSRLVRATSQLVQDSVYTSTLNNVRGSGNPVRYYEACASWLAENSTSGTTEASDMRAAWRALARLHLIGSSLDAGLIAPPPGAGADLAAIIPRRRRQALDTSPLPSLDLRAMHDQVMSLVKNMFTSNTLTPSQQQAAFRIVTTTQDLLGTQSLLILGYDPAKVNLTQTQVLQLLSDIKTSNNMTASQSAQISQLASDMQVRIIQSLVNLLNLTPQQLNITQENFSKVMAMPTFTNFPTPATAPVTATTSITSKSSSTTSFAAVPVVTTTARGAAGSTTSSTTPSTTKTIPVVIVGSSTTTKTSTTTLSSTTSRSGFLPGDVSDPTIFQYDDDSQGVGVSSTSRPVGTTTTTMTTTITTSSSRWGLVAGAVLNSTTGRTSTSSPVLGNSVEPILGPLPDYESLQLTCDALRLAGRSAAVLDSAALGRMTDAEVLDCLEVLGQLDFEPANVATIAAAIWDLLGRTPGLLPPGGGQLRGNLMAMLGGLLPAIAAANPQAIDLNLKSNFDGLSILGEKLQSSSNSSNLTRLLVNQYLKSGQQLSAVDVVGLGPLLCDLNATEWSLLVPDKLAAGVLEETLSGLACNISYDVRGQVTRVVNGSYGGQLPAAATWSSSDLMSLGWLLASLDTTTAAVGDNASSLLLLAKIPPTAIDGMCGAAASCLGRVGGLTADQLELLSPHTASMLTRPLAAAAYIEPAKRRAIRAAGGESPELLRVLDQLEMNFKLLDREQKQAAAVPVVPVRSSGPGRPDQVTTTLLIVVACSSLYIL